ncbi:MAG: tetratricopeptide repeat protein [Candidatus Hodarchaeota archaeon]
MGSKEAMYCFEAYGFFYLFLTVVGFILNLEGLDWASPRIIITGSLSALFFIISGSIKTKIDQRFSRADKEDIQKLKNGFNLKDKDFTMNKKGYIIRIRSKNPKVHYELGNELSNKGLHKEAISAYKRAIKLKPNYAEAINNLGFTYDELGNKLDAINEYKKAIIANPKYSDAFFNLGIAYKEIKVYNEAIKALENFIDISNSDEVKDVEQAHKLITELKEMIGSSKNDDEKGVSSHGVQSYERVGKGE